MKSIHLNQRFRFLLLIFVISSFSALLIISCRKENNKIEVETDALSVPFNLSELQQQADFKKYLEETLVLLQDNVYTDLFLGYNISNFSDNDKQVVANRMLADHDFMNRLTKYKTIVRQIEIKYRASSFTKDVWNQIAKFGVKQGIYFLPGLKEKVKLMEGKAIAKLQIGKGTNSNTVECCPCSDLVDQANVDLAVSVAELSVVCLAMSQFPPAAAFCWAGVAAFYLSQNAYINSTDYWCECMFENYGVCVY